MSINGKWEQLYLLMLGQLGGNPQLLCLHTLLGIAAVAAQGFSHSPIWLANQQGGAEQPILQPYKGSLKAASPQNGGALKQGCRSNFSTQGGWQGDNRTRKRYHQPSVQSALCTLGSSHCLCLLKHSTEWVLCRSTGRETPQQCWPTLHRNCSRRDGLYI